MVDSLHGIKDNPQAGYYDLDLIKGMGIILVISGHFMEPLKKISSIFNTLFVLIYSFHMPLFCFVSAI